MRLAVCTQTPLVRLLGDAPVSEGIVDVSWMKENVEYVFSPGGVTRMVYPLLVRMFRNGVLEDACWVSLNPKGPERIRFGRIEVWNVRVEESHLKSYGVVKELLWRIFHGVQKDEPRSLVDVAWYEDYAYYNLYNRVCSETLMKLDNQHDFDLFYIHDFQQLPTGSMLETLKPKVFRWHIPFDERVISPKWAPFLKKYFDAYDAVIVSCKTYLKSLKRIGYGGKVFHVYPYIDFEEYVVPSRQKVSDFCDRFSIKEDDLVVALVARLDPLKGHDVAVKALARVVRRIPNVKLVIVGNGSFSSSRQGLGLSKADQWRQQLDELVKKLGVSENVVFTGHVSQEELGCVYERCDLTILPSRAEGFGLVVAESWLYRKPSIVSVHAGIAELVEHGSTGLLVNPDNPEQVEEAMVKLLNDEKTRLEMGAKAGEAVALCSIERGLREEMEVLSIILQGGE
ncbi:MAG: glycosyltransferase family 4 protein [Candidatus Caldarchaeum sp.]|uniref:Glycosyltransferase family 1 protein n=1 Tax=Caldiarchaeum subterraneum TaxID=311458 RepID=A0A7J3VTL7_CALS0